MRIFRLPSIFRFLYPGAIFRLGNGEKTLFLTFDDGPEEGVTEKIIYILKQEHIKATFFILGSSAEKFPELFSKIKSDGHSIANHGYMHIKGCKTGNREYIDNVKKGAAITGSSLFRPPFGSLGLRQFSCLRKEFRIIFWDLILYDFDSSFRNEKILKVLRKRIRPGSIIVLHDNAKSSSPQILKELIGTVREMGYTFGDLEAEMKTRLQF